MMGEVIPMWSRDSIPDGCLKPLQTSYVTFVSNTALLAFTFETRPGLWVDTAVTRLLGKRVCIGGEGVLVRKNRLLYGNQNSLVVENLPAQYQFQGNEGKEVLKRLLATLMLLQWDGRKGILLVNGIENVFFFQSEKGGPQYAIEIFREPRCVDWHLSVVELGDCEWQKGARIFSADGRLYDEQPHKGVIPLSH